MSSPTCLLWLSVEKMNQSVLEPKALPPEQQPLTRIPLPLSAAGHRAMWLTPEKPASWLLCRDLTPSGDVGQSLPTLPKSSSKSAWRGGCPASSSLSPSSSFPPDPICRQPLPTKSYSLVGHAHLPRPLFQLEGGELQRHSFITCRCSHQRRDPR